MVAHLLLLTALNFSGLALAYAQESANETISTDRPSIGTGSDLVAPHFVVVESGTTWVRSGAVQMVDGTENLTRFGITKWLELRTQAPSIQWETDVRTIQRQDAGFSAKMHLPSSTAWPLATIVNVSVPIGSSGVSSGGWDPSFLLATSHVLNSRLSFTMSDNLSWVSNGEPGRIVLSQMSVAPYLKISRNGMLFGEWAPFVSHNPGGFGYTGDSGILWTIHGRFQFDARAGATIDRDGLRHLLAGAGFSVMTKRR